MNGSRISAVSTTEMHDVNRRTRRSKRISRNSGIVVIPLLRYTGRKISAMATIDSDDQTSHVINNMPC